MRGTVLITGAGRGLGLALARAFAAAGWRVHATMRDLAPFEATDGVTVHGCALDDWRAIERLAEEIDEPVDVLIANAATWAGAAFRADELDPDEMLGAFAVNTVAPALLAKHFKRHLLRGTRRTILMMSTGNASLSGNVAGEMLAYRATKSALNQVVRTLAAEWKDAGIATIALNPGWVRTDMGGPNAPLSAEEAARDVVAFASDPEIARFSGGFVNTDGSPIPF